MKGKSGQEFRCDNCGHVWVARNPTAARRECSKCRSTAVSLVDQMKDEAQPEPSNYGMKRGVANSSPDELPSWLESDNEIKAKTRELYLARLERKIAEEKAIVIKGETLERLNFILRDLINDLYLSETIDKENFDFYYSYCIWCGAEGDEGMHYVESLNTVVCSSCGHRLT